jgi:ADP-heptose:LPS heptosyltransferase
MICKTVVQAIPDVCFVNLQYGDTDYEVRVVQQQGGINIWRTPKIDLTRNLDDVAALICACDAVLTIGNATAHLCGALGKPATVLLPFAPSWRWMAEGRRTPWYASLELFRKDTPSTAWEEVITSALPGLSSQLHLGDSSVATE